MNRFIGALMQTITLLAPASVGRIHLEFQYRRIKNYSAILAFAAVLALYPSQATFAASPIPQSGWSLVFVDSQETVGQNNRAVNAFDGSLTSLWHTEWSQSSPPPPHEIQINLGAMYTLSGFRYFPRQIGYNGTIAQYEFYVSASGPPFNWVMVANGTFATSQTEKEVPFAPVAGQYVRLRALSEVNGNPWTSVAELNVLGVLVAQ